MGIGLSSTVQWLCRCSGCYTLCPGCSPLLLGITPSWPNFAAWLLGSGMLSLGSLFLLEDVDLTLVRLGNHDSCQELLNWVKTFVLCHWAHWNREKCEFLKTSSVTVVKHNTELHPYIYSSMICCVFLSDVHNIPRVHWFCLKIQAGNICEELVSIKKYVIKKSLA